MDINFDEIKLNRRPMPYDWRDFRLANYITPEMRELASRRAWWDWPIAFVLNQGTTPECVGFAWANFGVSYPIEQLTWTDEMGHKIYAQAKIEDGHPEYDGSDTRSGAEAFMHFSNLKNNVYAFAHNIDEIIVWLSTVGPVITGTNWYTLMFQPDSSGMVHIGGNLAGGHEWMLSGVDTNRKVFHCTNSWGKGWGVNGQFSISFSDYERLMAEEGDAVTTAEVIGGTPPPPDERPGCLPKALYKLYQWSK